MALRLLSSTFLGAVLLAGVRATHPARGYGLKTKKRQKRVYIAVRVISWF